ncbi:MAG: sigma-70 family RNA polymerase sigma factor [Alphaproteobacteria bacterium]
MGLKAYTTKALSVQDINERVRLHMPLARKIAWQIHGRVRDLLDIDDLIQIGMTALVEAAQRFQDTGEATFGSYATIRVRGALVDHVRNNLTLTRTGVQRRDRIAQAKRDLIAEGKDAENQSLIAEKLGIGVPELQVWYGQIAKTSDKSLDEIYDDHSVWFADERPTPEHALLSGELRERLVANLKKLNERDAMVLQLYYVEEMNLEEIAESLSISIGRVSQIKKAAIGQLRNWMGED